MFNFVIHVLLFFFQSTCWSFLILLCYHLIQLHILFFRWMWSWEVWVSCSKKTKDSKIFAGFYWVCKKSCFNTDATALFLQSSQETQKKWGKHILTLDWGISHVNIGIGLMSGMHKWRHIREYHRNWNALHTTKPKHCFEVPITVCLFLLRVAQNMKELMQGTSIRRMFILGINPF